MTDFAEFGIRADTSELDSASRKLRKLGDEGDKSEKRLSSSASKTAAAFGKVAGAIGLVTAGISAIGLKGSLGFEKSIKEVSTLVDGLEGDIDRISTASRRLSTEFGGSSTEQAKGFYQAISAGASNASQATAVLETANRLAIGGVSDVASSVDILTTVMNTYGDQVEGAGAVSDALFVGMRAGKTTITELSSSLGKVVPLSAQLGISFDELVATTAALTKGGISTTESITGIRAVLASITKPASDAAKAAKELGVDFNVTALRSKGLAGFLNELKEATGGSSEEISRLFGGVEALIPVMSLTGNIGDDLAEIMVQMANKVGETDKAFQKMADDNQFKIDQFMSSVNNVALTLGGTLADVLAPAAQAASRALNDLFSNTIQDESGIDVQRAKVQSLTEEIEHLTGLKGVLGIFGPNKAEFDKLEDQLEAAQEELARLERVAEKAALATRKVFSTNFSPIDLDAERRQKERAERERVIRSKSSAVQISESQRLIESLKKQADEAGKTGVELFRLRASILGNSEEAEKYISVIEKKNKADEEQRNASRLLASDLREIDEITQSVATNQEKLSKELANLDRLRGITDETGKAVLSQQDYLRAVDQTKGKFRELEREGINSFSSIEQFTIQAARNIQSSFADFLFDPFDEGLKGMIKGFANTLRRLVAESASAKILEATGVAQIFGSSTSNSGGGSSGFSFSNAASLVSAGKTAFDVFTGNIVSSLSTGISSLGQTFGSSALTSFSAGLSGSASAGVFGAGGTPFLSGGIGSAGTAAAPGVVGPAGGSFAGAGATAAPFIASAGLVAAAGIATQQLNDLIENNKKIAGVSGDVLNAVINPISQIPIIGDFLPDFGGAITALFGRGEIKRKETNLIGDVTSEGFEGITSTKLKAEGGLFASDLVKRLLLDIDTGDLAPGSTEKFPELAAQLKPLVEQFGENLDLSIQTLSKSLLPVADNIGTKDLSTFSTDVNIASEKGEFFNSDQILEELQRIEEEMIRHLVPSIDTLIKGGETISQAFQRIGSEFNTLAALGNVLGNSTETAKEFLRTVSVESRSAFIAQAGGQQALGSKIDFFADNFLTDVERLAPSIELVNKELLELGVSSDITKEQFKELVQSYGKLGGVTEDTVIRLLNLAPAFVNVRDSSAEATDAVLDFADAQREVTQLRSNLVSSYNRERSELQGVISEFDNLSNTLLSFKDRLALGDLSPLTPGQKLDEARQQFNETRRLAEGGDKDAIGRLPDIAQSFLQASQTFNASGGTFASDFNLVQSVLDNVGAVAQSEADLARLQLTELESTVSKLTDIDSGIVSIDEGIRELIVAVLNGQGNPDITSSDIEKTTSSGTIEDILSSLIKDGVNVKQLLEAGVSKSIIDFVSEGASVLDSEITNFANSQTDPIEIYRAAIAHGISAERLSNVLELSLDEINKFILDNGLKSFDEAREQRKDELFGEPTINNITNVAPDSNQSSQNNSTPQIDSSASNVISFPNLIDQSNIGSNNADTPNETSNQQILDFVAANPDPFAIHTAASDNNISFERLARVTNTPLEEIEDFARANNLAFLNRGTDTTSSDGLAFLHKNEAVVPSSVPDEIKLLREEIRQLREDQNRQTDALINVTRQSSRDNAKVIVQANKESDQLMNWRDRSAVGAS